MIKNNKKEGAAIGKFIAFILTFSVMINVAMVDVSAAAIVPPTNIKKNISDISVPADITLLKEKMIKGIEKTIAVLEKMETKIQNDDNIDDASKSELIDSLNKAESGLKAYENEIEKANTAKELMEINKEVVQYLIANKETIKENMKNMAVYIGNLTVQKVEKLKEDIEKLLEILKIVCPSEIETITEVENQLKQMESEVDILKQAISDKDTMTIKKQVEAISKLSLEMMKNVQELEEVCLP